MKYKMPCIKDIVTYMGKKNKQKQTHTKNKKKNNNNKKKQQKNNNINFACWMIIFRYLWTLVQKPFQTSFMECFLSLSIFYLIRQTVPN